METEFLSWLTHWHQTLPTLTFSELGTNPQNTAVISVDMVAGFCHSGPLASQEVKHIIPSVVSLFTNAKKVGIDTFLLIQDAHDANAAEFSAYPPHCIKGTKEAACIKELQSLPFSDSFVTFEKNTLSPAYDTQLDKYLATHQSLDTFILVGNCTDLCIYTLAMHLRLQANSANLKRRIIIPEEAVATYDLSVSQAEKLKSLPHPQKLLHPLFLYHMALNDITIVKNMR